MLQQNTANRMAQKNKNSSSHFWGLEVYSPKADRLQFPLRVLEESLPNLFLHPVNDSNTLVTLGCRSIPPFPAFVFTCYSPGIQVSCHIRTPVMLDLGPILLQFDLIITWLHLQTLSNSLRHRRQHLEHEHTSAWERIQPIKYAECLTSGASKSRRESPTWHRTQLREHSHRCCYKQ